MALRLRKAVSVHDVERHPAGGPLTVIEAGVYARDIPEHMLEQLHADHFEDDGLDVHESDSLVKRRGNRLHKGDDSESVADNGTHEGDDA